MTTVAQPTTGEVLMAAILADPDDEAPRLIYSDWLEENGQVERAWLIREAPAIKWYRRRYGKWDWEREYSSSPLRREPYWNLFNNGELWNRCTRAAIPLFPQTWRRNLHSVVYRRGFVDELGVDRFHSNTFCIMEKQPVQKVTTSAEALLEVVDKFGKCKSLRTIRLTTLPEESRAYQDIGNACIMYFSGVRRQIVIPYYWQAMTAVDRSAAGVAYRLGRVVGHYFTPLGITVLL